MAYLRNSLRIAVLLGSTILVACGGGYYSSAVVIGAPPPPVYGPVGYAPGPGFIWTDGFYDLQGGRWVWVGGHWLRPPHPGYRWVRPYWEPRGRGYRFHRGYWRR